MAAPRGGWHLGKAAVNPSWTFRVGLLPDETISSWLVRAALTHACSPRELTGWISPRWRPWMADVDRGVSEGHLEALQHHSGIEADAFRSAALAPIASRIEGTTPHPRLAWRWILTRGPSTARQQGTAQFCPQCLAADRAPYYRISWRLAWHTTCSTHGVSLADRCPECGSAVLPHRLDEEAPHVATCAACGADLRGGKGVPSSPDALLFQEMADRVVQGGEAMCLGKRVGTRDWFESTDFFASLVRRAARQPTRSLTTFLKILKVEPPSDVAPVPGARIDRLGCRDRQPVLEGVWRVVSAERGRFQDAVLESGVSRQGLFEKGQRIPQVVARFVPKLPENGRAKYSPRAGRQHGPRSRNEVLRMMRRLERALESEGR